MESFIHSFICSPTHQMPTACRCLGASGKLDVSSSLAVAFSFFLLGEGNLPSNKSGPSCSSVSRCSQEQTRLEFTPSSVTPNGVVTQVKLWLRAGTSRHFLKGGRRVLFRHGCHPVPFAVMDSHHSTAHGLISSLSREVWGQIYCRTRQEEVPGCL